MAQRPPFWQYASLDYSNKMSEDFEFQLKQQQIEEQRSETLAGNEKVDGSTFTDTDGTVYEWDGKQRGWFPKIDDDFLASYQAAYGIAQEQDPTDQGTDKPTSSSRAADKETSSPDAGSNERSNDSKRSASAVSEEGQEGETSTAAKKKKQEGWFDMDGSLNTNVYVNGLPTDITEEEFVDLMTKYGIVKDSEETGEPKVKLYRDSSGELKGDGLCCYLKKESVELAIKLLDDSTYRGCKVYVKPAHFELKGAYKPNLKKKKPSQGKKKTNQQQKLLGWKETLGPKRTKFEKIVILENMFDPKEIEINPASLQDIKEDVREECEKYGPVRKLLVYDRNPDGIISVGFRDFESADLCIQTLQGRYFGGKVLKAYPWDGETSFLVEETEEERKKRLKDWEKYLEEDAKDDQTAS